MTDLRLDYITFFWYLSSFDHLWKNNSNNIPHLLYDSLTKQREKTPYRPPSPNLR